MNRVNKICPYCENPKYMVDISEYSKQFPYKCINCNRYFREEDFGWKETIEIVPSDEAVPKPNKNLVEVVRCYECKWYKWGDPDAETVYCQLHGRCHEYNWYCADGERSEL